MPNRNIDPDEKQACIDDMAKGMTPKDAAKKHGMSPASAARWADKEGIKVEKEEKGDKETTKTTRREAPMAKAARSVGRPKSAGRARAGVDELFPGAEHVASANRIMTALRKEHPTTLGILKSLMVG